MNQAVPPLRPFSTEPRSPCFVSIVASWRWSATALCVHCTRHRARRPGAMGGTSPTESSSHSRCSRLRGQDTWFVRAKESEQIQGPILTAVGELRGRDSLSHPGMRLLHLNNRGHRKPLPITYCEAMRARQRYKISPRHQSCRGDHWAEIDEELSRDSSICDGGSAPRRSSSRSCQRPTA